MSQWENLTMLSQESIQNFVLCFDLMVTQVFHTMSQEQLNNLKFVKWLVQLSTEVKLMVLQQTESDYNIAVEKAALVKRLSTNVLVHKSQKCENVNSITTSRDDQKVEFQKRSRNFNQPAKIKHNNMKFNNYKFQNRSVIKRTQC